MAYFGLHFSRGDAKVSIRAQAIITYAACLQVRFVIGSGGATIKSIRHGTRTFIKFDRDEADPSAPVLFRIEGHSAEGVDEARLRIQEIIGMCVLPVLLCPGGSIVFAGRVYWQGMANVRCLVFVTTSCTEKTGLATGMERRRP